jgi:hypothetical protein
MFVERPQQGSVPRVFVDQVEPQKELRVPAVAGEREIAGAHQQPSPLRVEEERRLRMKDDVRNLEEVVGEPASRTALSRIHDRDDGRLLQRAAGFTMIPRRLLDGIGSQAQDGTKDVVLEESRVESKRGENGSETALFGHEPIEHPSRRDLHAILPRSVRSCRTTASLKPGNAASLSWPV